MIFFLMLSAVGLILALKACHMLQGSMLLACILLALTFISIFNLSNSTSHALRIPSLTLDWWGMSIPGILLPHSRSRCQNSGHLSQLATGCVTCHTSHGCVTHFRPILGNLVEVTLVTSPFMYIVSHAKGTSFP